MANTSHSPHTPKRTGSRKGRKRKPRNFDAKARRIVSKVVNVGTVPKPHGRRQATNPSSRPIPRDHALVPVPPPSWRARVDERELEYAAKAHWLPGFERIVQLGVVTLFTGVSGVGKSSLVGYIAAAITKENKHAVIYRSDEDSQAKWDKRIKLMGGNLDFLHYVHDQAQVLAILQANDAPALLVIDPLQQYLGSGVKNDEAARKSMNELTRLAAKNHMGIVGIIHWKEYRNKVMGSDAIVQIARHCLKIERCDSEHGRTLRVFKSQDAPVEEFLKFRTFKVNPDDDTEPAQVKFESTNWEKAIDSKEADLADIERYIIELTKGLPTRVKWVQDEVESQGWINYRRDIVPWMKRNGWKSIRGGPRPSNAMLRIRSKNNAEKIEQGQVPDVPVGVFWWVPNRGKGYRWHKDDGGWLKAEEKGIWRKLQDPSLDQWLQQTAEEDAYDAATMEGWFGKDFAEDWKEARQRARDRTMNVPPDGHTKASRQGASISSRQEDGQLS